MSQALLEIQNLSFSYHRKRVLHDVSFSLHRGEVVSIIGPSGSGKSTLLRSLALLARPTNGAILFQGRTVFSSSHPVRKEQQREYTNALGIVFQQLYLWPHMTAIENVILPLVRGLGVGHELARHTARNLLTQLGLESVMSQYPQKLSVGQQQRCAIARTLVMEPTILLLDEITSALDPELVVSIQALIREIASEPNRTLLIVTHEMEFASRVSDRIGFLDGGELTAIGTPAELSAVTVNSRILSFISGHGVTNGADSSE